jgi:hypothetical protein
MTPVFSDLFTETPTSVELPDQVKVITDSVEKPKRFCKTCGNEVTRFLKSTKDWWAWCSNKCMSVDPDVLKKKAETNKKRHGGHPMHMPELRKKHKQTFLDKYGVDNPSKAESVKQKMRETFLRNYGVDNPSKDPAIIDRIREDAITRFATSKDDILEKRKQTCMEEYGVEWSSQRHLSADSIEKMHDIEYLKYQHFTLNKPCEQIARELGCSPNPLFNTFEVNGIIPNKFKWSSSGEIELYEFVKSLISDEIIKHDRRLIQPKELDLYIPSRGLAFEYDGIYWHSELNGMSKNYHMNKVDACEKQNVRLIQIYDSDWVNKQDIVKSRIRNLVGLSTKYYARKCNIVTLTSKEAIAFFMKNHIQGKCQATKYFGLELNNQLVAAAAFSKSRFSKKYQWELIRYCNQLDSTVVGGFSKLLTHFIKIENPESLVSYADRRWSAGNVYETNGFKFEHNSPPNYLYFSSKNTNELMSRIAFQKHKLKDKLPVFDDNLSEWENMKANGYNRIWDSGNKVYVWRNNDNLS